MFCPKCGQQTEEGGMFCQNCGAALLNIQSGVIKISKQKGGTIIDTLKLIGGGMAILGFLSFITSILKTDISGRLREVLLGFGIGIGLVGSIGYIIFSAVGRIANK
jgi:hypothetical protein